MNFVVYKSSAGSGKTHTLVKEYLKLVISNPENFRNILAITFTNKAANEMKARILDYLGNLRRYPFNVRSGLMDDLIGSLINELNLTENQISERADKSLSLILHNYSGFAVSTIDSFVHKLVRSFAYDLHLPLNFDVELDTNKLISKSIDLLISKVGSDEKLTKILVQFISTKMDDEKSWNIENELAAFAKRLLDEDSLTAIRKLEDLDVEDFVRVNGKLTEIIKKFENSLRQKGTQAIQLIEKKQINIDSFFQAKNGIGRYFKRLAEGRWDKITPNSYVNATISDNKWTASKCPAPVSAAIQSIANDLRDIFYQIQDIIEHDLASYNICRLIARNIYPIAVLNEIQKVMDEFRINENIVHISEFNKRISDIIAGEPAPFIYERIGEKYKHFLLDEFQDTSILQWQNMLPLLENSLSNNNFNLIVGDGKQSIYRWRNGEVEQFASLPAVFQRGNDPVSISRENLLQSHYQEKVLQYNFRSGCEIVNFNNSFFNFTKNRLSDDFRGIYDNVEQLCAGKNTGGLVHLEFMNKKSLGDDFEEQELERIREIITTDLAGYPLSGIAVLVRRNEDGSKVAAHLLQNGINVLSSEALLISSDRQVRFIISFIRFLLRGQDKISLTEMLQYLVETRQIPFENLNEALAGFSNSGLNKILNFIPGSKNPERLQMLNLIDLVDELIRIFRLNPGEKNPFIRFFRDFILDYVGKYNDGLSDFLNFWQTKGMKESIVIPEGIEAVNVMTIHKAKGLEFPVVIYPFAQNQSKPSLKNLWIEPQMEAIPELKAALVGIYKPLQETVFKEVYDKEIEKSFLDLLNLLYVVMTRPTERLYILTNDKTAEKKDEKTGETKSSWTDATPFPDAADLYHGFLMEKGDWQPQKSIYIFGNQNERKESTTRSFPENPEPSDGTFTTARWDQLIRLSRRAPKVWDVEDPERNRQWGNLVHTIMAEIVTTADIEPAVNRTISNGQLAPEEKEKLIKAIREAVSNPLISNYFSEGVQAKNEQDILLADGSILRPDRLVFTPEKTVIIDYKTGQEADSHKAQLLKYEETLLEMNFKDCEKYLVYLDEGKVVKG